MDPAERLALLYGGAPLITSGLVHVTAAVRERERWHVLAIGPHAPTSESDFFVLSSTRARADALLTSARNLRKEPLLQHALPAALMAYRAALGKISPLVCAILTRDGDIPLDHGVFDDWTEKLVLTRPEVEDALREKLLGRAEVVGLRDLSPARAVRYLRARGHALVSLEAGPSTAAQLYEDGRERATELLLTSFEGALPDARGLGPALPEDALLFAGRVLLGESTVEEPSGRFRFACYRLRDQNQR